MTRNDNKNCALDDVKIGALFCVCVMFGCMLFAYYDILNKLDDMPHYECTIEIESYGIEVLSANDAYSKCLLEGLSESRCRDETLISRYHGGCGDTCSSSCRVGECVHYPHHKSTDKLNVICEDGLEISDGSPYWFTMLNSGHETKTCMVSVETEVCVIK